MTVSDLDIWRSAKLLCEQHGADAAIHAAQGADAMLEAGDLDGLATWKRILSAVEWLLSPGNRNKGESTNLPH